MPRSPVPQRTSLVVLGLLVLLAVLGWAMYLSVKAGYDAQQARFNQERTELTGRVADLEGTLATERSTSSGRIAGLEDTLAGERAAAGDLAALTGRIEQAKADLNRRMTALGERERDRAAAEAALGETRSQLTALTEQRAGATGRLNQRLMVLGQREVDLASAGRALDHARAERDRLQAEIAGLEQTFANRNGTLGAVDVKLAALLRERAKATAALERTQGALAGTQTTLTEVEAKLDKALLAQDVAELAASRDGAPARGRRPQRRAGSQAAAVPSERERQSPAAGSGRAVALALDRTRQADRPAAGAGRRARQGSAKGTRPVPSGRRRTWSS